MGRTRNPYVAFWRYVGRTCRGFWRSVMTFGAAGVLLWIVVRSSERASAETVWIVGAIAAVSLWGILFTWLKGRERKDLLEGAGQLARVGVAVSSQMGGGLLGNFGGLGFSTAPALNVANELPSEDQR